MKWQAIDDVHYPYCEDKNTFCWTLVWFDDISSRTKFELAIFKKREKWFLIDGQVVEPTHFMNIIGPYEDA